MKKLIFGIFLMAFFVTVKSQQYKPVIDSAAGTWVIDLRPTPASAPYLKDFKITKITGNKFDGEFYGYPFTGGYINADWDKIYFAFTTTDQSGTYFHSGSIEGGKVSGVSLNESRQLFIPWRGQKK